MPGPDEQGYYPYVGDRDKLPWAMQQAGYPVRTQADLLALTPMLRQDKEQADGTWHITELNNRSYGYMPDAASGVAVDQALTQTGIAYPEGFAEVYPLEGTWAEVLAILRA